MANKKKKLSKLQKNQEEEKVKKKLEKKGAYMKNIPEHLFNLFNDSELMMTAIENNPIAFTWIPHKYKVQESYILKAVEKDGTMFKFADIKLRHDKNFVLLVVQTNGYALEYTLAFKNDKDVVLTAIESKPRSIQYASDNLKDDDEVVKFAIERDGYSLKYASNRIKSDPKMLLNALKTDQRAFKFIKFEYNEEIIENLLRKGFKRILKYCIDYKYQSNQELIWLSSGNYKTISELKQFRNITFKFN